MKLIPLAPKSTIMFIVIEGNIGAGKTTLAKKLSDALEAEYLPERFEENPYLPAFYKDRSRFALHTELWFLLDRFNQLQNLNSNKVVVSDYHILKSEVFASVNLEGEEMMIYNEVLQHLKLSEKAFRKPDLLIYLDISMEQLSHKVAERARPYEMGIDNLYLERIAHAYNNYIICIGERNRLRFTHHNQLDLRILLEKVEEIRNFEAPEGLN